MEERVRSLMFFFFQAEDGIRDLVRSHGLGDVYKRQELAAAHERGIADDGVHRSGEFEGPVECGYFGAQLSLIHI